MKTMEHIRCHYSRLNCLHRFLWKCVNYDRVEDAIEILEYILKVREEKLGTANPDVEDEKRRLAELLKESGRSRNRKGKSLENLLDSNSRRKKKDVTKRRSGFSFKS
ncbi:hypothetical protein Patl1_00630 [Pistacia atlantica]|nr:hypothetical protein Patl1_00630 [Pistacia atlantica]